MRLIKAHDPRAFDGAAADWVNARVLEKPNSVLALPTGRTPIGLYAELVARVHARHLDLTRVMFFNLDEYCGLAIEDPHSYATFLREHFITPANIAAESVRLLQGDASDPVIECSTYDTQLGGYGGLDSCILGLGVNGHIAFNEPGSAWNQRTHRVQLSASTRALHEQQARSPWSIPPMGLTMGITTILEARHILLMVAGSKKRTALDALYRGKPDIAWPVTSLIEHPDLTVIEFCESVGDR